MRRVKSDWGGGGESGSVGRVLTRAAQRAHSLTAYIQVKPAQRLIVCAVRAVKKCT